MSAGGEGVGAVLTTIPRLRTYWLKCCGPGVEREKVAPELSIWHVVTKTATCSATTHS